MIFLNRISRKDKWLFFYYTCLTAILVILLYLFRYVYPSKTSYFLVVRIHNFIEFSLLTYIFTFSINNRIIRKLIAFSIIPFFFICILDYFTSAAPDLAYFPLIVESLFFIILIIYFFFEKIKQDVAEPLFNNFIFWFAVAFLINFAGNFLLFVYSKTSHDDKDFLSNYNTIYSIVTIVKNVLLCIAAIIKEPLKPKTGLYDGLIPDSDFKDILNTRNPNNIK